MWKKLGRIYCATGKYQWAKTHAYMPTPIRLNDDTIRVYVSFLDDDKVGRIGYVDIEVDNPLHILRISEKPVLDIGEDGTFDDSGVTPMSIIRYKSKLLLYYMGWQRGVKVRYYLFTGLAVSRDNGETFQRYSRVPILDRNDQELFIRSAAYVLNDDGLYKMWYVAGDRWISIHDKKVPTYGLRYLESDNPFSWPKVGKVCMNPVGDEYGFGRPWVVRENNMYKMWYSIRTFSKGYRIGYAESSNGVDWIRKDDSAGIDVSSNINEWDSKMVCFASIIRLDDKVYMFYNGNNYGETGFGVAVLDKDS